VQVEQERQGAATKAAHQQLQKELEGFGREVAALKEEGRGAAATAAATQQQLEKELEGSRQEGAVLLKSLDVAEATITLQGGVMAQVRDGAG
jgi:hypothetical protein